MLMSNSMVLTMLAHVLSTTALLIFAYIMIISFLIYKFIKIWVLSINMLFYKKKLKHKAVLLI